MRQSRLKRCTSILTLAVMIAYSTTPVSAIETAGEVFVNLDAATFTTGDTTWSNAGTYVDFEAVNGPVGGFIETTPVIFFDGSNAFVGGTLDDPVEAPDGLTGFEPTRTIEVWAFNPSIDSEETLVSWGNRGGPNGTNMAFNYGNHGKFGAVGHWGGDDPDVGWIDNGPNDIEDPGNWTAGAPDAGAWHHLVYTSDDEYARVYSDGELWNQENMQQYGGLDTYLDPAIAIASQWEADAFTLTGNLRGDLAIGRVRIHDGVLTGDQILSNYNEEKDGFVNPPPPEPPVPEPIPFGPVHRYSFTSDTGDSVGGADGTIVDAGTEQNFEFTDGRLDLSANTGESSAAITEDAYVDLPNGIVTAAAGSREEGAISFEFWASVSETHTWQRFGDFGSSNNGEDTSDGGGAAAYMLITPNSGRYGNGLEMTNHTESGAEPNVGVAGEFPIDEESHVVAVYDHEDTSEGDNGSMHLYLNGELKGSNEIAPDFDLLTMIDDNNWLGRSQWPDPILDGAFNEFRIYDYALTTNQVLGNFNSGADALNLGGGPGDYNNDGVVDVADINLQADAIASANPDLGVFDENNDGVVNEDDRYIWVHDHKNTWIGDANLDGEFKSGDLVIVFGAGKYETGDSSLWEEGDWNGDMLFSSGDLVVAFGDGGYEMGPKAQAAAVPEPTGIMLVLMGGLTLIASIRRRRSR